MTVNCKSGDEDNRLFDIRTLRLFLNQVCSICKMGAFVSKADQSWHTRQGYKPSVPFLRARERYRFRNSMTGLVLLGFIGGVYWYTLKAVDQDTFEDVPMPPPPSLPETYEGVRHKNINPSLEGVKKS